VPDGDQLFIGLTKIDYRNYEKNDNFILAQEEVEAALATKPNGALFGSSYYRTPFPYGLWVWNAFQDSESKFGQWMTKAFGKPPVLMSQVNPALRASVAHSLLRNYGYFHNQVSYENVPQKNPKKGKIGYTVDMGHLFTLDTVAYVGFPQEADSLIRATADEAKIRQGSPFTVASLDAERTRVASLLRNNGYYYYQPGYASYLADTLAVPGKVQLRLQMADDVPQLATHKWYMGKVTMDIRKSFMEQLTDSLQRRTLTIRFNGKNPKLRPRVVLGGMRLRPRQLYSHDAYLETMNNLNAMGLFSMTDFTFTPRDTSAACDTLDLQLNCVLDKPYDFYIETNFKNRTLGRMGPELKVGLTKRNAFRGGEKFDINLHGSYEWQTHNRGKDMNSYEYGADASIEFPRIVAPFYNSSRIRRDKNGRPVFRHRVSTPTTLAKASTDIVSRPGFYKMHIVSGEWTYRWQSSVNSRHEFSPLTLKYQFMNNQTADFDSILVDNPYLMTTMSDVFIPQMRYSYVYTSPAGTLHPLRWETTLSESGNLVSLAMLAGGKKWNEPGKKMFKNEYSQFLRLETDFTKTWQLNAHDQLVAHANAGVIYSYGNSVAAPFSEVFYVGGANSLRAFPIRSVGPGKFYVEELSTQYSYLVQNGDVKLVANLEYRPRLFGNVYGAVFLDAGNVWMLESKYDDKEVRQYLRDFTFRPGKFLGQLAVGTGIGLRYDLDFLILRLDWGVGLHVPYDTGKSGFFNIKKFKDNQTLHFAIGYPF
jgi:outer membrane protein assembly factor BamA